MTDIPRTSERHGFEEYYFSCDCSTDEHTIRFTFDSHDGDLFVAVHLQPQYRWYQRIAAAIKYICGYRSKYGEFDTTLIRKEDAGRLIALLEKFRDHKPEQLESPNR